MNTSKKKSKVNKINARHIAVKVEQPSVQTPSVQTPSVQTLSVQTASVQRPSVQQPSVAALAYQFWLEEQCHGNDLKHWLRAEQQIKDAQI